MSFSLSGVSFFLFSVLIIAALGYLLGHISIRGVSLGAAGILILSILYGIFFYPSMDTQMESAASAALKIIENLGLICFVCSVGFLSGPSFVFNLRKNFKSYALLCLVIIGTGTVIAGICILFSRAMGLSGETELTAMISGLFSGALTSTPAFSAAKSTVERIDPELVDLVTVGNGIAYLFGVVGKVLFVQLIPLLEHADMEKERQKFVLPPTCASAETEKEYTPIDSNGLMPFFLAGALGILIGRFVFGEFSLTTTGGCLLVSLLMGHFRHIGRLSLTPPPQTLKLMREFGLCLFLLGAGIPGGAQFVEKFRLIYFVYGVVMTLLPLIVGYLFAKHILKMSLLNNLGSITGGMTSTPALGTLIQVSGTEDVAGAYAATYPIALVTVVFASQALILLFT